MLLQLYYPLFASVVYFPNTEPTGNKYSTLPVGVTINLSGKGINSNDSSCVLFLLGTLVNKLVIAILTFCPGIYWDSKWSPTPITYCSKSKVSLFKFPSATDTFNVTNNVLLEGVKSFIDSITEFNSSTVTLFSSVFLPFFNV